MGVKLKKSFMWLLLACFCVLSPIVTVSAEEEQVKAQAESSANGDVLAGDIIDVHLKIKGEPVRDVVVPSDVVLVMDCSGSMQLEDRFLQMQASAREFVQMIDFSSHELGIVAYDTSTKSCPITTDEDILDNFIDSLSIGGVTNTNLGIKEAQRLLATGRSSATKVIVLLTDGMASDMTAMKEAAKAAKDNDIVIFTVALLSAGEDPDTSAPNQELKEVATSQGHHHFVLGSEGLVPVYREIARQIGVANVYNVKIMQTISEQFEFVAGSADNNIPQPTFSGSTLTWRLEELREDTLVLSYQLRVKHGVKSGIYPHASYGNISYKTYDNRSKNVSIPMIPISVYNYPPVIDSVTPSVFELSGGEKTVIRGQNFDKNAKVKIDGTTISGATIADSSTIEFVMPSHKQGTAVISVWNPTGEKSEASVKFKAEPVITKITPNTCAYEGGRIVKFVCSHIMTGAKVTFDGIAADVTYYETEYIKVKVPFIDKAGAVDVVVTNPDGTTYTFANGFTYEAKPVPPIPVITGVTPNSGDELKSKAVKVVGNNFADGADFQITLGGVPMKTSIIEKTYIKCTVPNSLTAGTYDIELTNGDGQKALLANAYTYVGPPALQPPTITKITPNEVEANTAKAVKVVGANFVGGGNFKVMVDGKAVETTMIESTYIKCKFPAMPAGTYDVVVINADGQQAVLPNAYTSKGQPALPPPVLTKLSIKTGAVGAARLVKLTGKNFADGANFKVTIGNANAVVTIVESEYVKFKVPVTLPAGTYDLVLTNGDGQQAVLPNAYTYE